LGLILKATQILDFVHFNFKTFDNIWLSKS